MKNTATRAALLAFIEIHKPLNSSPTLMEEFTELVDAHETALVDDTIDGLKGAAEVEPVPTPTSASDEGVHSAEDI